MASLQIFYQKFLKALEFTELENLSNREQKLIQYFTNVLK